MKLATTELKLATTVFRQHELSACHKEAVERVITLPTATTDKGEALSATHAREKLENRQCLLKIPLDPLIFREAILCY